MGYHRCVDGEVAMGRCATIDTSDLVDPVTRRTLAAILTRPLRRRTDAGPDEVDEELAWFFDHDSRPTGGFFAQPKEECRTRRLDMRGPLDLEKGPIEMEEAPPDADGACLLRFGQV
jgi:hypothetical protein